VSNSPNLPNTLEIWDKKNINTMELTELVRIVGLTEHLKIKKKIKGKKKGSRSPLVLKSWSKLNSRLIC